MPNTLKEYSRKRDFSKTAEPEGTHGGDRKEKLSFVVQKHAATRLHYDFRLELDGVLKSWAVPKGPSLDPSDKRLAMHVEDHPVDYGSFEGTIPKGQYGGGTVLLWDRGWWEPLGDPQRDYRKGHLSFILHGERLHGAWTLARMGSSNGDKESWLLIKKHDAQASSGQAVPAESNARSISTGRSMEEITQGADPGMAQETDFHSIQNRVHDLDGATEAKMPRIILPQKAALSNSAPSGSHWIHEIKYDGYRIIASIDREEVRLATRNGKDWTERFAAVANDLQPLKGNRIILDGEVAVQSPDGRTDFQALQNVLSGVKSGQLVYFVFDLLYFNGVDIQGVTLQERKETLKNLLSIVYANHDRIRYGDHIESEGQVIYEHACKLGLEGIVSKRRTARYYQGRSRDWLKIKCAHRQEFVVGGFSEPSGSRSRFGALLLGYYNSEGKLLYCGKVGTGFTESTIDRVAATLQKLQQETSPFATLVDETRNVHWVKPTAVAEIEFRGWTDTDRLRQPSFKGLRQDKDALQVGRETDITARKEFPQSAAANHSPRKTALRKESSRRKMTMPKLTHPDKVLFPEQGVTKRALIDYYKLASDLMIPLVKRRPLALVRCPDGRHKQCFFQKHLADQAPPEVRTIPIQEKSEKREYAVIDSAESLLALVQISCLELHTWNARDDRIERPDMMVFDLDPGPGVEVPQIVEGAFMVREQLHDLGIESFVKSSGGKGLHVVVPLVRSLGWDEVKEFSRAVATKMAREHPRKFVATMAKARRPGKIFLDYVRNSRGHTTVAPYSTRARKGATVSVPLEWNELNDLSAPDYFNVTNVVSRLEKGIDPWSDFENSKQTIRKQARSKLGL